MDTSMTDATGSESPSSPSSPPPRRSRSRIQLSSASSQRQRRSWSPRSRSPSPSPSGSRRSRSRSWSPTACSFRPSTTTLPSLSDATTATVEEAGKTLFMFFWHIASPIAYSLYAIKVPNSLGPLPPLQPCDQLSGSNRTIYPILEFRKGDYPEEMCCVELESKLYFFGGEFTAVNNVHVKVDERVMDDKNLCPPDVYVLDTATIPTNIDTMSNQPSEWLRKGIPMNSGKTNPYAFVAHRKIYALATSDDSYEPRFEVFDLDSNQWSILPNPPMETRFTAHAVVGRKVFIVTIDRRVFSYDVDACEWAQRREVWYRPFVGRGEFVEDTLFGIFRHSVTAIGPTTEANPFQARGSLQCMALLSNSSDVANLIRKRKQDRDYSSYLVHLGNRIFFYVLLVTRPDPKPRVSTYFKDKENLDVSIITFEALRETYAEPFSGGIRTFFLAKLLHDVQYVARSKGGADLGYNAMRFCCWI